MITPVRIQRSRRKGSKLTSPNGLEVVCVGRGGMWGNPFKVGAVLGESTIIDAADCVAAFRLWLEVNPIGQTVASAARQRLRGCNLACWCKPGDPCHADVLLEIANAPLPLPSPEARQPAPAEGRAL